MPVRRLLLQIVAFLAFISPITGPCLEADEPPADRGIGKRVPDFSLKDINGKPVRLYSYAGKKAAVIFFLGNGCPISDLYLPRLAELARTYEKKEIVFIAIDSNRGSEAVKLAAAVKQAEIRFPVLLDPGNLVADQLFAQRTCETLVVDGRNAALLYRGPIDDQYSQQNRRKEPSQRYLVDALEDLLAGRKVRVKSAEAAGCPIERVEAKVPTVQKLARPANREKPPEEPLPDVGKVNFSADVAPIMRQKCQGCHRPGQIGPFSLLTFEEVRNRATAIREVVADLSMPPWHADPKHGKFKNDRSLSARERATILAWIDQKMPQGDSKSEPAPLPAAGEWQIGKPDHVFTMPEAFNVPAQGVLPYQVFRIPTNFKEDTWVRAIEARPGERAVVHHIVVYAVDQKKNHINLSIYAPGMAPMIYPEGTAKRIPAGAELVLQMHYTPVGRALSDRSSVGLILAKGPVENRAQTLDIMNKSFEIPANHDNFLVEAQMTVPRDAQLLGLFPHMHLRGKDFRYEATYPDGRKEVLLHVPAYAFGWQTQYVLAEPKTLPKGTKIDCRAHFDNSEKNPANPDPKKTVRWGEQTSDEMMIGFIEAVVAEAPGKSKSKDETRNKKD